jgi:hypothetical protein
LWLWTSQAPEIVREMGCLLSDLGWGESRMGQFFWPWQMGACVFALETAGKFDPLLTLDTLA